MKVLLSIFLLLLNTASFSSTEAEIHLSKMLEKYKSFNSYEDSGTSLTKYIKTNGKTRNTELTFTTKYNKNNSLHFQWLKLPSELEKKIHTLEKNPNPLKPKTNTIWKNKTGIYSKYSFSRKNKEPNLSSALSGATGVSGGLAWLVPRFLSSEISCPVNLSANKSKLITINPNTIIIKQNYSSGTIRKLHIDRKSYLLNKIEENRKLSSGTTTYQVIKYNIINAK